MKLEINENYKRHIVGFVGICACVHRYKYIQLVNGFKWKIKWEKNISFRQWFTNSQASLHNLFFGDSMRVLRPLCSVASIPLKSFNFNWSQKSKANREAAKTRLCISVGLLLFIFFDSFFFSFISRFLYKKRFTICIFYLISYFFPFILQIS